MVVGMKLVRDGQADAFVSAGNSGGVLATALVSAGRMRREVPPESVARAQRSAPRNTRAFGRGLIVADLVAHPRETYDVDWDVVSVDHAILPLRRPHHTYEREARAFLARA
jgi:hypothetical protein